MMPLLDMLAASWDAGEPGADAKHGEDLLNIFAQSTKIMKRTCDVSGVNFGMMEPILGMVKKAQKVYRLGSTLVDLAPLLFKD